MKQKQTNAPSSVANYYKRGVFVLVRKFPSGEDSYITFKPKNEAMGPLQASFHLAIFNELQFANWYLVNFRKGLRENNTSDFSADDPFLILEILDQARWDLVRKVVLAEGLATNAVLNPCEGDETHRCPIVYVDFDDYADFSKLQNVFSRYPNQHISIEDEKHKISAKDLVMLSGPEKLLPFGVRKHKILFIDDDKFLTDLYGRKLREAGFEMETWNRIPEGDWVEKVLKIKPDLISTDILMPGIDGYEAMRTLKSDLRTEDIPVFGFDNLCQPDDIKMAIDCGAVDYLCKAAVTPSEVVRVFGNYLNDPVNHKQGEYSSPDRRPNYN